jgi:hypothetical protein
MSRLAKNSFKATCAGEAAMGLRLQRAGRTGISFYILPDSLWKLIRRLPDVWAQLR